MRAPAAAWILCIAALAGACTMTVELSAVRLMAPWFGTSSGVWTNVIGVVLLALSTGYLLGARLSRRAEPAGAWGVTLLLSAVAAAWLPALAGPVSRVFLPAGLALDESAELLQWGSLATALVLFLPAAMLLGCTPPLATEMLDRLTSRGAGSSGGIVLSASTIGSIAGTFATTYLALPILGLTRTFIVAGGLLAALGAWLLWRQKLGAPSRAHLLLIPVLAAGFLARWRAPDVPAGFHLLESVDSAYQSSRIVEGDVDGTSLRRLQVNEGLDSFQSVWRAQTGLLPPGYYYNLFALPPWWSEPKSEWRVLVLGLAGGTTWRVLEGTLPPGVTLRASGVEIDPAIVGLGERWMELPRGDPDRRVLAGWDARAALPRIEGPFDEIILDAYANQMEIPAHLSTREFFEEVRARLAPDGWLCINVGSFGLSDPIVEAVASTVARAFDQRVLVVRVPFARNCVLFARAGAHPPDPSTTYARHEQAGIDGILAAIALPGAFRWCDPDPARILTDDWNPIEELQRRSIREGPKRLIETP